MPDTGNAKDCLKLPPTNFSIFTLKSVSWRTYLVSTGLFSVSFCLYRACFTHLISSISRSTIPRVNNIRPVYGTVINWFTLIKKIMQTSIVIVSGSIINASTVHLNGIWHLIWRYISKPVLGGHPVLSGHYSIPRGCPLNTGFTVHTLCSGTKRPVNWLVKKQHATGIEKYWALRYSPLIFKLQVTFTKPLSFKTTFIGRSIIMYFNHA